MDIIDKYHARNLIKPSLLILELFSTLKYYSKIRQENSCEFYFVNNLKCDEVWRDYGRFTRCNVSTQDYRHNLVSKTLQSRLNNEAGILEMMLARFYRIPMISFKEVAFPSWVRHFINYNEPVLWPFVRCDNHHINDDGHRMIAYNMLIPFLLDQYNQVDIISKNSNNNIMISPEKSLLGASIYSKHIEMFPRHTDKVIENWLLWRNNPDLDIFTQIIVPTANWGIDKSKSKYTNRCYSSSTLHSIAIFNITIPHTCERQNISCSLNIYYLRSWNTSFVGNLTCSLYMHHRIHHHINQKLKHNKHETTNSKAHGSNHHPLQTNVLIDGNKFHNKHTIPASSKIFTSISVAGKYEIQCKKPDNKYSCIGGLSLTQTSMTSHHVKPRFFKDGFT
jgi:hypothetical protein